MPQLIVYLDAAARVVAIARKLHAEYPTLLSVRGIPRYCLRIVSSCQHHSWARREIAGSTILGTFLSIAAKGNIGTVDVIERRKADQTGSEGGIGSGRT